VDVSAIQHVGVGGQGGKKITVFVAHREIFMAGAICTLCLNAGALLDVLGQTSEASDIPEEIRRLCPTIALIDAMMPNLCVEQLAGHLRQSESPTRIVVLGADASAATFFRTMRSGIAGFLLPSSNPAELPIALESVARNGIYITPQMHRVMWRHTAFCDQSTLTERHRGILELLEAGKTSKEISAALGITVKTVDNHRAELMRRLGLHKASALTRYLERHKSET
jgi:DNA-binding NarL/FixJ family response regulator